MKPLELVIYPLSNVFPAGYHLPRASYITFRAANRMAEEKHLTPAELAAESWRMMSDWQMAHIDQEPTEKYRARCETLHRFATLPHYDEVPE